ncbi:peptidase inhibitor family I36 protein [Streptacidiphilus jiangxiensis]|uniref:Peptidase inhibitor family I36 n=1 Tax=Streptacidiphilus jiangxiensis TaxID=235985 RepID=A0A1H7X773_STRJI|nr:peptidase inhibitor family I36 protein [Streptacidiphilus jiangxiensis]SEM29515.1 Peptidase inhibitor family I36 [Streptacidiphilus jiangxiensis]
MRIKLGRLTATVTAVAALTVGATSLTTGNAFAAGPGGVEACPSGNVCLYFNSPQYGWGAWEDWSPGQSLSLTDFTFAHWGNGSGYGQTVYDRAASIVNNTGHTVIVESDLGHDDYVVAGYAGSLDSGTYNNDSLLYC